MHCADEPCPAWPDDQPQESSTFSSMMKSISDRLKMLSGQYLPDHPWGPLWVSSS